MADLKKVCPPKAEREKAVWIAPDDEWFTRGKSERRHDNEISISRWNADLP